jgi:hypothetical protein
MVGYWKIFVQHGPVNSLRGWGDLVRNVNAVARPVFAAASDATPADIQSDQLNAGNFIATEDDWGQRFDFNPTVYNSADEAHAAWQKFAQKRWALFKMRITTDLDPAISALSIENEQRGWLGWKQEGDPNPEVGSIPGFTGWADCEGWQAYYTALEILKDTKPWRYFAFAYSGGLPELGVWEQPGMRAYLELCAGHPDRLGVALHEYSFNDDLFNSVTWGNSSTDAVGWNIFRFKHLFDACDRMGIRWPQVHIKEFGWHERKLGPTKEITRRDLERAAEVYAQYPQIEGVALWTGARGWGDVDKQVEGLIPFMQEMALTRTWEIEEPTEPPVEPPEPPVVPPVVPPTAKIMLKNPTFEDGWTDQSMTAQEPNGWGLHIDFSGEVRGRKINGDPECVHKGIDQLPPDERPGGENELILDGFYNYKLFTSAVWRATLSQTIHDATPGAKVKLTVPVNIHFDGRGDEYDQEDTLFRVSVNHEHTDFWMLKKFDRRWVYVEAFGTVDENGVVYVELECSVKWEHHTAFFLDDLRIEYVSAPPVEPLPTDKPKIVVLKLAQEHAEGAWTSNATFAFNNFKRTITVSYEDMLTLMGAGNSDSYAIVVDPDYPSQQETIGMLKARGYKYEVQYYDLSPTP